MTLEVDPAAIDRYANELAGHAGDVEAMRRYTNEYTAFGWHEAGFINYFRTPHAHFAESALAALGHLHDLLASCETELAKVAGYYRTTDHATAEKLDGTYPPVPRPSRADVDGDPYAEDLPYG